MPTVAVSAHDIDTAGLALDTAIPAAWLTEALADAELTAEAPGRITGRLSRSGESIVVRGRVKANLVTPCARCLSPAAVNVDTELALLLKPVPQAGRKGPAAASHAHGEHRGEHRGEQKAGNRGEQKAGKENGKRGAAAVEPEYEYFYFYIYHDFCLFYYIYYFFYDVPKRRTLHGARISNIIDSNDI